MIVIIFEKTLAKMPDSFYVVRDNEIVGRYGTDLDEAIKHIKLFGKSTSGPNRMIVPILNGKAVDPKNHLYQEQVQQQLVTAETLQTISDYCHWENDLVLENMLSIAEQEHQITMPFNQSHYTPSSFSSLFEEYRQETIREACHQYFERMGQELSKANVDCHVIEEEEETMESGSYRMKRKSCDSILTHNCETKRTRPKNETPPTVFIENLKEFVAGNIKI